MTYPILKALGRDAPIGLIHIDAHCDTMGAFDGSKFHHGGLFRIAVLEGVLDPERTIQIGICGPRLCRNRSMHRALILGDSGS